MMKTVIPYLRLLTLPVDKLDQLAKYLSNSQKLFLANRLMFKEENIAGNVSTRLNMSTESRSQPEQVLSKKFEFVAEDLIKTDFEMLGTEIKKNTMWKSLQIKLVAKQHLFVKGIEVLTRANNFPQFELVSNNNVPSSR